MFNIVFQWSGLGELVSMMEQKPCCSIDNLYGECESWFLEIIDIVVSREWEDEVKDGLYEVGWGGQKAWHSSPIVHYSYLKTQQLHNLKIEF